MSAAATAGILRAVWLAAIPSLLAGCGGGGGGGDANASPGASASPTPGDVGISGSVTFDKVPAVAGRGLDYAQTEARPVRGVTVEAVRGEEVVAVSATDESGRYALVLDRGLEGVLIRVSAVLERSGTPGWHYRVVDNTQADALYVLESGAFSTGADDLVLDLHAASGWDGQSYSAPRAAAPFAILDVVYEATQRVLETAPDTLFPPLVLHWSPSNVPSRAESGEPDFATGEIGNSLFTPGAGIYLLGATESDTDEYDRHVIAHEWAHYFEHALARSDSIGGAHARGDQLDLRTAFSEGFGNAMSAILTGDPVYVDALGPAQARSFGFDVEGPYSPHGALNPHPGWFSEESIQEILYDLYDELPDTPQDLLALGLGPMLEAMTQGLRETPALTSIFAFAQALKAARPDIDPLTVDALLEAHGIGPFSDEYGSGEKNAGTPSDPAMSVADAEKEILPVYKAISVGGPAVNVCSTDAYNHDGPSGSGNKLGSRAFLRFSIEAAGSYTFTARTGAVPEGETADPDMVLHRRGRLADGISNGSPDPLTCTVEAPEGCVERFTRTLQPDGYVLEVYEWTNTQPADGEFPPIGRTCFEVEIATP